MAREPRVAAARQPWAKLLPPLSGRGHAAKRRPVGNNEAVLGRLDVAAFRASIRTYCGGAGFVRRGTTFGSNTVRVGNPVFGSCYIFPVVPFPQPPKIAEVEIASMFGLGRCK